MKEYTVLIDKVNDVNVGDKDIIKGKDAFDAARARFPNREVYETYGNDFNFSLMEVKIDRFNRCFLQTKTRQNFIVK